MDENNNQDSVLGRLKNRHLFRIAAMYLVASWVLLQFGEIMIDLMELPKWVGRALIVLLSLGFPFVVLFAWVFDTTQKELSTANVEQSQSPKKFTRQINFIIAALTALGIGLTFYIWPSDVDDHSDGEFTQSDPTETMAPLSQHNNAASRKYILIGNLVDFTGSSGLSGQTYGQAIIDATNWINENGGINGKLVDLDTVETSYQVRRAMTAYEKWSTQGIVALQGWGTAIGSALKSKINADRIPYFSASYSAEFTDPKGIQTGESAPYNFFYGASYSDGCRGLVQWARSDWNRRETSQKPTYVHMGDNQPYPNAPRPACEAYAEELGFEVFEPIIFSMVPGDYSKQCDRLTELKPNYVFLANLDKSVSALLKQCATLVDDSQFMANIWGFDESVMQSAGIAAHGVVWVMGASSWNDSSPGMYTVREISKMSDPQGLKYRSVHYMRGICSTFYLKEALEIAEGKGSLDGRSIKAALYEQEEWVPRGLEGVCLPATWTSEDHRGVTRVLIYQASVAADPKNQPIQVLIDNGTIAMAPIFEAKIERKQSWLGW